MMLTNMRSPSLVGIASKHHPHSAIIADTLVLPHPQSIFDFAISVAVIHHLSTSSRRIAAIAQVLSTLKTPSDGELQTVYAQALFYVWALEQKGSRRGWSEDNEQDVMVPWVINSKSKSNSQQNKAKPNVEPPQDGRFVQLPKTLQRYYHLYRHGELENDICAAGGTVLSSGYEKDNWWAIATRARAD